MISLFDSHFKATVHLIPRPSHWESAYSGTISHTASAVRPQQLPPSVSSDIIPLKKYSHLFLWAFGTVLCLRLHSNVQSWHKVITVVRHIGVYLHWLIGTWSDYINIISAEFLFKKYITNLPAFIVSPFDLKVDKVWQFKNKIIIIQCKRRVSVMKLM